MIRTKPNPLLTGLRGKVDALMGSRAWTPAGVAAHLVCTVDAARLALDDLVRGGLVEVEGGRYWRRAD